MGETLIQLGRELEIAVYGAGLFAPILPHMGPDMAVKRAVDLAAVEELGQVFQRMKLTPFKISGIDDPLPVLVGKARGSDVNAISRRISTGEGAGATRSLNHNPAPSIDRPASLA